MSTTIRNITAEVYESERAPPERHWLVNLRYEITGKATTGKVSVEGVNITCFASSRAEAVQKAEEHIEFHAKLIGDRDEKNRLALKALSLKRLKEAVGA